MTTSNFLPEDYMARKAERRTNIICLGLFAIVMTGVFGAFLVTNRAWTQVKHEQEMINVRYQQAGKQIQELTELESQHDEMLHKAELVAALVERVPRSILMAELINRMPPQLGLIEFEVKSEKRLSRATPTAQTSRLSGRNRTPTREETREQEQEQRVEPPRFRVTLAMVGVAPTDLEVSRYLAALNNYPLLRDVTLVYSEHREIDERRMRQFRISMQLATDADVRHIEPLTMRRGLRNPMANETILPGQQTAPAQPGRADTAAVPNDERN